MKLTLTVDLDELHSALMDLHSRMDHDPEVASIRASTMINVMVSAAVSVEEETK